MGRPAAAIEDDTPLDGARVDVAARIRWLLRTHRLAAGLTLDDLARRLRDDGHTASRASLSSGERSGTRSGALVAGYEAAVGLEPGHLQAAVDIVCRTFDYAPDDARPAPALQGVADLDEAFDRVHPAPGGGAGAAGGAGSDWFRVARAVGPHGRGWVPTAVMAPLVERLVSEMVRSVGVAHLQRYEAVALLRTGDYAEVVEEVVRGLVEQPDAPSVAATAMAAAAERPTPGLLDWAASLLLDPAGWRVRAAALGLEGMRAAGGLPDEAWLRVAEPLAAALRCAEEEDDPDRAVVLTVMFKNLPRAAREAAVAAGAGSLLRGVPTPESWRDDDANAHLALCRRLVREAAHEAGLPEQPLATRLLFEVLYDFRSARSVTSAFLLMASPLAHGVLRRLLPLARPGTPDPVTRAGALRGVHLLQTPEDDDDVRAWFAAGWPALGRGSLLAAGNAGAPLPDDVVALAVAPHEPDARALEALGLSRHPAIPEIAARADVPAEVAAGARWWQRHGGRVVH